MELEITRARVVAEFIRIGGAAALALLLLHRAELAVDRVGLRRLAMSKSLADVSGG
jgi:hypothetical protein